MKTARRMLAITLLALGPVACGRGCTCFEGEKTYEKLHGKVDVSLVRKTRWTGGRIPGPVSSFFLHVETTPPFDEPVGDCTHVDMVEDDAGKHVAFRCKDTKEWSVLRLRGGDRRIRECSAPVGTESKPKLDRLETVRQSAPRILACERADTPYLMEELVHAVLEDEGADAAADFAVTLASDASARESGVQADPWDRAVGALDGPSKTRALAGLCRTLEQADGRASRAAYVRAAMRCPLESEAVAQGALATARFLLTNSEKLPESEIRKDEALLWAGLIAGARTPKELGSLVCDRARQGDVREDTRAVLLQLIAHTRVSCDVIDAWLKAPLCDPSLDCDGGLCTEAELANDSAGWNAALDGGQRPSPSLPTRERAVLRAGYARGPLPPGVTLANARRRYSLPDGGRLPSCYRGDLEVGTACDCSSLSSLALCSVTTEPTRGEERYLVTGGCKLRIDDAHHRLETAHFTCARLGESCVQVGQTSQTGQTAECCGGMVCRLGICEPPPGVAADAAHDR